MAFTLPRIVYPTQPATPSSAGLSSVAGGALGAATYYVYLTYVTPWGESLVSVEASLAVGANRLLVVTSPAVPPPPSVAVGYNVYVSTTSTTETKQNASFIEIGTDWTLPTSGLIAGSAVPSSWGGVLDFSRQPLHTPYDVIKAVRHDSFSTAGARQAITERVEHYLNLTVDNVNIGADVAAWDAFLLQATQGIPFDYYVDGTSTNYKTYSLVEMERPIAYKSMGLYNLSLTMRQEVDQTNSMLVLPPANNVHLIPFTTAAAGDFTIAHGLGYQPTYFGAPLVTSAGAVWYQPTLVDATYIYLTASAGGLTGYVLVG